MRIPPLSGLFLKLSKPTGSQAAPVPRQVPDGDEQALALKLIEWGRHHDPVLVLFAVFNLLVENAKNQGLRTQAKVVSRRVMNDPAASVGPDQRRAFGLVAGQELFGAQGETGWQQVCASLAAHHGWSRFFYSATYATEQFPSSPFEQKSYLPADAAYQIQVIQSDLRSKWVSSNLDANTAPAPGSLSGPRL